VRWLAVLVTLVLGSGAAGCGEAERSSGEEGAGGAGAANDHVDPSGEVPLINGLERDPGSGDLLLTTNRGFFRIDPETGEAERVRGTIKAGNAASTVGSFLYVHAVGPGEYIGSGHPEEPTLPEFLGLIGTTDGGETWTPMSRLGEADLHKIVLAHDRMYAFDAVLGAMLVSTDDGETFTERFTPRGLILDFVVDPEDPDVLLASTEDQVFRTGDGGDSWRPIQQAAGVRLAWPAPDALYRATSAGAIERSADGGDTWEQVGQVDGEPYKFKPVGPEELYLAMADATVLHSIDGGETWEPVFTP
jgi:hypothetical protein